MRSKRQDRFSPPAVGGISLLVVFAVLCLTVFALLSLATVQADVRLAEASAKAVADYYAADAKAQEILALLRAGEPLPDDIEGKTTIAHTSHGAEYTYGYSVPISETQELEVEVTISGSGYGIWRWEAVPAQQWESNDTLELWDGAMF